MRVAKLEHVMTKFYVETIVPWNGRRAVHAIESDSAAEAWDYVRRWLGMAYVSRDDMRDHKPEEVEINVYAPVDLAVYEAG